MRHEAREMALDSVPLDGTLAADVHDAHGALLIPAGATLAEATLNSLRRRGIESVSVLVECPEDPGQTEARQRELERRLRHAFRLAGDDGPARELRQLVTDYRRSRAS